MREVSSKDGNLRGSLLDLHRLTTWKELATRMQVNSERGDPMRYLVGLPLFLVFFAVVWGCSPETSVDASRIDENQPASTEVAPNTAPQSPAEPAPAPAPSAPRQQATRP